MSQGVLPHPEPTPTPRAVPVLLAQQEAHDYLGFVVLLPGGPLSEVCQALPPSGPYTRSAFPPVQCVLDSSCRGLGRARCCQAGLCTSPSLPELLSMVRAGFSCRVCGDSPSRHHFPTLPPQSRKEYFFSQTCNCPSRSLVFFSRLMLGLLASHGYLA